MFSFNLAERCQGCSQLASSDACVLWRHVSVFISNMEILGWRWAENVQPLQCPGAYSVWCQERDLKSWVHVMFQLHWSWALGRVTVSQYLRASVSSTNLWGYDMTKL